MIAAARLPLRSDPAKSQFGSVASQMVSRNRSLRKLAQAAALSTGQVILTGVRGC